MVEIGVNDENVVARYEFSINFLYTDARRLIDTGVQIAVNMTATLTRDYSSSSPFAIAVAV